MVEPFWIGYHPPPLDLSSSYFLWFFISSPFLVVQPQKKLFWCVFLYAICRVSTNTTFEVAHGYLRISLRIFFFFPEYLEAKGMCITFRKWKSLNPLNTKSCYIHPPYLNPDYGPSPHHHGPFWWLFRVEQKGAINMSSQLDRPGENAAKNAGRQIYANAAISSFAHMVWVSIRQTRRHLFVIRSHIGVKVWIHFREFLYFVD